jgi:hypothetical protein
LEKPKSVYALDNPNYNITELRDHTYNNNEPQINGGGQVVWAGYDGNDYEIFFFDGEKTTQLTNNTDNDNAPDINNKGHITWMTLDNISLERKGVFYYDGSIINKISNRGEDPKINDSDNIVWFDYDGQDNEIFLNNGSGTIQLTDNSWNDLGPKISNSGSITWLNWTNQQVMYYDGSSITQLTDNATENLDVEINDNGLAVWTSINSSAGKNDIFLYDKQNSIQISNNIGYNQKPQINSSGDVVWYCYNDNTPNHPDNIYLFKYQQQEVIRLPQLPTSNLNTPFRNPDINSKGEVVWQGDLGNWYEIFLFDGTKTVQITDNSNIDMYPKISDNGIITWSNGRNDLPYGIYIAQPLTKISQNFISGWTMVSLPLTPVNPNPIVVFSGNDISGSLSRYDPTINSYISYDEFNPNEFGNISVGVGYWFNCPNPEGCTVSYEASLSPPSNEIPISKSGWNIIGKPFNSDLNLADVMVRNNTTGEAISFYNAALNGWLDIPLAGYKCNNGYYYVGIAQPPWFSWEFNDFSVHPWEGYWLSSNIDNLTLIFP